MARLKYLTPQSVNLEWLTILQWPPVIYVKMCNMLLENVQSGVEMYSQKDRNVFNKRILFFFSTE